MDINQAFEILKNAGGVRAARIITANHESIPAWRVYWAARGLRRGVPVAKIVRQKWFYGMPFYTDKWTLDPRPDTETLVSAVLETRDKRQETRDKRQETSILDLGTGTGCIIAAIVNNMPGATGVGIDRSIMAVRIARKNVRDLGLADRIEIKCRNFEIPAPNPRPQFDIIVSNPPYIAHSDRRVNVGALYDPHVALFARKNGLAAYESIAKFAHEWLKPGGNLYLEIGAGQGIDVKNIFANAGWTFVRAWDDLGGVERVLCFRFSQ